MLEIEECPNTHEMERERPIHLRKLEAFIGSKVLPPIFRGMISRYCFCLYSVNFMPLWDQLSKTLVVCAENDQNIVWTNFEKCLKLSDEYNPPRTITSEYLLEDVQSKQISGGTASFGTKDVKSKRIYESNYNDHSKTWQKIQTEIESEMTNTNLFIQLTFQNHDPIDLTNIYRLLITFLQRVPKMLLDNSKPLVEIFLKITGTDDETKNARVKTLAFLNSFSKVTKPRKLYKNGELYTEFMKLLANGDPRLQSAALDCVFMWRFPGMIKYKDTLIGLADDDRLRDSLAVLDMEEIRSTVLQEDQKMLVDSICRILYGKVISRKGRSSSKAGIKARRTAIFAFIATMDDAEREYMMALMFEPFIGCLVSNSEKEYHVEDLELSSFKKQLGFLNVCEDFVQQLRTLVSSSIPSILKIVLTMIHYAEEFIELNKGDEYEKTQARQVRLLGMKRLIQLYSINVDFDFDSYINQHFQSFINKRVLKLVDENTQAPSAILDLFQAWSMDRRYIKYLVNYNKSLVRELLLLLSAKKVQDTVVSFLVGIIENIQDAHDQFPESQILPKFLETEIALLLVQYEKVLLRIVDTTDTKTRLSGITVPTRIIKSLARISVFVEDAECAEKLVTILVPFLKSSDKLVPEVTKTEILKILSNFLPLLPSIKQTHPTRTIYYPILSQLFLILQTREARTTLIEVFKRLSTFGKGLENLVTILDDLNSFSDKMMDEPDFDRRFSAFTKINQTEYQNFNALEWTPVLYNLFYFINDVTEFAIRTSSTHGIQKFIEQVVVDIEKVKEGSSFESLLIHLVFPQIKKGIKQAVMPCREEFITLLGVVVKTHGTMPQFQDMTCLLGDVNDEETNFFLNIIHLQTHRKVKALRQLSTLGREGKLSNSNISNIFISLCAYFVFESSKEKDHNLINETMITIQGLCSTLEWNAYYAVLRRFMNSLKFRPELEKILIRLLVFILEEFRFEMVVDPVVEAVAVEMNVQIEDAMDVDDDMDVEAEPTLDIKVNQAAKIHTVVTEKLLPSLQTLIATKNDETVPLRVPLAIAIAKLLLKLPKKSLHVQLPKLLLNLCNILSSHLQSSRDSARSTLVTISGMLGPEYLYYIITSLRTALKRGYQLHVLGYTLNAIMAENVDKYEPTSIDICVKPIVEIAIQDIFGETGKEREVQELRGKMREIRTTKSFETLEFLAKLASFNQIENILRPLKEQMLDANQTAVVKKIEDVFRRVAVGINANKSIDLVSFMIFVQKLLSESLPLSKSDFVPQKKLKETEKHIRVQMKRTDAEITLKYYEENAHLFVEFGLSLLLTSLKRERISIKDLSHLEMLDPLVSLVGKSLYAKHTTVNILAIRIYMILVKFPLPDLVPTNPVVVKRVFQLIARTSSTNSDLIQSVFKLLTVILKDCKHIDVPSHNIITLLAILGPDLEEPEKQTTTFSLIRAILERQIVCLEIYDLMDLIAKVLITSQSNHVRELCRHAYIQFLTNYPHGHARLRKQITYLVSNLDYVFESGRMSVLELFNLALKNFSDELFLEYADMLFLSIVMILQNDDSENCREMASILIKTLLKRLDVSRLEKPLKLVSKWFKQELKELQSISCQVVGLLIETFGDRVQKFVGGWCDDLILLLEKCLEEWTINQYESELDEELPLWELGYFALKTLSKFMKNNPGSVIQSSNSERLWELVYELSTHPHQWVRLICAQLLGALFSKIDASSRCLVGAIASEKPIKLLDGEIEVANLGRKCYQQLDSDFLTSDLSKQIIKNLFFLSKAMLTFLKETNEEIEEEIKIMDDLKDMEDEENEEEDSKFVPGSSLMFLVKKLSFLARTDGLKKRGNLLVFNY
jgi:U3 small nucleolar RNA-associated protein 20